MIFSIFLVLFFSLASGTPFLGKSLRKWDQQKGLFQGDIEMDGRNGLLPTSLRRWPNGIVYYDWTYTNWTSEYVDMLNQAFRMIEKHTCIKFVRRTNQKNFIDIVDGQSCSSELVGMSGFQQRLSLMSSDEKGATCWGLGTVMHELLHAIGLWHEQMRYDRDDFLELHPENFLYGTDFQFQKISANSSSTYDIPYNYRSVMHYSAYAFTKNDQPTMTPKKPGFKLEDLGSGELWEYEGDWEKVRRIYSCQGTYPLEACVDNYGSCESYKTQCNSLEWMKQYCPKTCNFCPNDNCKDELSYCNKYVDQCGKEAWTKSSCKKTCGFC